MVAVLFMLLGSFLIGIASPPEAQAQAVAGQLVIAGNGPELLVIEKLVKAFEKANSRAYLDIQWDEHAKPVEMVKSGQAQIAVTGHEDPDLRATQVAWDGIAVIVNLSNHTKEVAAQQVADLFSGKIRSWSDLGGPETKVLVIDRPRNRNIRDAFEQFVGAQGRIQNNARVIGPDDKAIKTVAGTLPPLSAVTYISLEAALEAVSTGVAVRLLPIDKVEPEEPTVKDGRYKLRRPVLLLSKKEPTPLIQAFEAFALSKEGQKILRQEYIPRWTRRKNARQEEVRDYDALLDIHHRGGCVSVAGVRSGRVGMGAGGKRGRGHRVQSLRDGIHQGTRCLEGREGPGVRPEQAPTDHQGRAR